MEVRRDGAVLQRKDGFENSRHSGGGLEMSEVGLDRADEERSGAIAREDTRQRFELDRIAEGCAGAVRFDVADVVRRDACARERGAHDRLLREQVRRGHAVAASVLVHGRAANQSVDVIAVALRVGKAPQQQQSAAFGAHESVRAGVKRAAVAVRRERAHFRKTDVSLRRENHVHAGGERPVGRAFAQTRAREIDRDE